MVQKRWAAGPVSYSFQTGQKIRVGSYFQTQIELGTRPTEKKEILNHLKIFAIAYYSFP